MNEYNRDLEEVATAHSKEQTMTSATVQNAQLSHGLSHQGSNIVITTTHENGGGVSQEGSYGIIGGSRQLS